MSIVCSYKHQTFINRYLVTGSIKRYILTQKPEESNKIVLEDSMLKAVKISVTFSKKAITISNGVHCNN